MKVALQNPILNLDGTNVKDKGINVNLARILVLSLTADHADEKNLKGEDKLKRYNLALQITNCTEPTIDLTAEQVTLLKTLTAKVVKTVIYGQVDAYLEGKPTGIVQKVEEPINEPTPEE